MQPWSLLVLVVAAVSCQSGPSPAEEHNSHQLSLEDSSFQTFYAQFISDSVFQLSSIDFPIRGQYEDYETQRPWKRETWPLINWDLYDTQANLGDSISIVQDSLSFFYGVYSRDSGLSFEMEFEKHEGKWWMSYRQENNY